MSATRTVDAPVTTERYPCFDGLRAIAAVAVLMHHASIETAFSVRGKWRLPGTHVTWMVGHYFTRMDAGVQIFFLISGFLLYRPFVAAAFGGRPAPSTRRFFRRRFLRIFPAYWVAYVSIALFVGLDMPIGGARSMLEQFFLVHLYDLGDGGARALGGISQSWTLVVELSFYAFVPLYAWCIRRVADRAHMSRVRVEVAGLVSLYAVSVVWRAVDTWVFTGALRNLAQYWLPAQLDLFAMGMALAVVKTWSERRTAPVAALETVGRLDWLSWMCAAAAFTLVTFGIGLPSILQTVWGWHAYAKQLLYGLTAFFLLLPAVFGPQDRGVTRRFLRLAPVAYLGMVSYGIYLWHQAFLKKIHQWGGWAPKPGENPLAGFRGGFTVHVLAALALSATVASLSWYLVERPLLRRRDLLVAGTRA